MLEERERWNRARYRQGGRRQIQEKGDTHNRATHRIEEKGERLNIAKYRE